MVLAPDLPALNVPGTSATAANHRECSLPDGLGQLLLGLREQRVLVVLPRGHQSQSVLRVLCRALIAEGGNTPVLAARESASVGALLASLSEGLLDRVPSAAAGITPGAIESALRRTCEAAGEGGHLWLLLDRVVVDLGDAEACQHERFQYLKVARELGRTLTVVDFMRDEDLERLDSEKLVGVATAFEAMVAVRPRSGGPQWVSFVFNTEARRAPRAQRTAMGISTRSRFAKLALFGLAAVLASVVAARLGARGGAGQGMARGGGIHARPSTAGSTPSAPSISARPESEAVAVPARSEVAPTAAPTRPDALQAPLIRPAAEPTAEGPIAAAPTSPSMQEPTAEQPAATAPPSPSMQEPAPTTESLSANGATAIPSAPAFPLAGGPEAVEWERVPRSHTAARTPGRTPFEAEELRRYHAQVERAVALSRRRPDDPVAPLEVLESAEGAVRLRDPSLAAEVVGLIRNYADRDLSMRGCRPGTSFAAKLVQLNRLLPPSQQMPQDMVTSVRHRLRQGCTDD